MAIVGRTGSGKSTLINAILRAVPLTQGTVSIDGEDVSGLPLHILRRRVALCPQNPVLFSGTVRANLDPFSERTDAEMLQILSVLQAIADGDAEEQDDRAEETETPRSSSQLDLDLELSSGGSNISAGQRQVVSLARVLLMRPKLLLLDEATSDIDHDTDRAIQRALLSSQQGGRNSAGTTLLTIAHRLQSIMRYDTVLVLEDGRIVEQGCPAALIEEPESRFGKMCRAAGEERLRMLRELAMRD